MPDTPCELPLLLDTLNSLNAATKKKNKSCHNLHFLHDSHGDCAGGEEGGADGH